MAGNRLLNLSGRSGPPGLDSPDDMPPMGQMAGMHKGMMGGGMMPPKGPPGPPQPPPPGAGEGPAEPEGPQEKGGEKMPTTPEEAIGVLQDFGITPDDFPMLKAAVDIIADAMGAEREGAKEDAAPAEEPEAA